MWIAARIILGSGELIRSLIQEIRLIPEDGRLRVELKGELAGILALADSTKPGSKAAGLAEALNTLLKREIEEAIGGQLGYLLKGFSDRSPAYFSTANRVHCGDVSVMCPDFQHRACISVRHLIYGFVEAR